MTVTDSRSETGANVTIAIARILLIAVTILCFVATLPESNDKSFAVGGLLGAAGLASLILCPFLLLRNKGWKSRRIWIHALVLIGWMPAAIAASWTLRSVAEDRASAFVEILNEHMSRSGGLPSNEAELAMAKLELPTTFFGSPMHYRMANIDESRWEYAVSKATKTKWKIDRSKPVFVVSFPIAEGWVICERLSQAAVYICDD